MLRLIQRTAGQHKLSAPWEGPFIISKVLGNDSYYLIDAQKTRARKRDDSGKETERPWHANLLRRFIVDAVCTMLSFVLSTKTPGPLRRARGLPSFIYMISIMPMNVLFHYSAWHWVRPVGPGARRLVLCGASCSWISSVLAPKPSPARNHSSQSDCPVGRS